MREAFRLTLSQAKLVTVIVTVSNQAPTQQEIEDQVVEHSIWKDEMDDMLSDYD